MKTILKQPQRGILVHTDEVMEADKMRPTIAALILTCTLFALLAPRSPQRAAGEQNCTIVKEALDDSLHLKVGMTRREVEKNFRLDGGMQFFSSFRYAYSKCEYIKLDIAFKHAVPGNSIVSSPDDTVVKI